MRDIRQMLSDTAGGAAIVLAVTMPVVIGGLGFGVEAGHWYFNQRKLQNAADIAAYAAAAELRAGRSLEVIEASAAAAAARTGYDAGRGTIAVATPYGGSASQVEVRLGESLPRQFSALFAEGNVDLGGRAVARITEGVQTCVLALDPSAPQAVIFTGNSETILVGCNVHANSLRDDAVYIQGSPEVEADCMSAAGGVHVQDDKLLTLNQCVAPYEHADVVPDPYDDLPVPSLSGPCEPPPANSPQSSFTISATCYSGSLDLKGTIHLEPGTYVVHGDVHIGSQAKVTGEGVTIYIVGSGEFKTNGTPEVQLRAPTSGDYEGVLIFADRNASLSSEHRINGNAQSYYDGAIYARHGFVDYLGNNTTSGGCSQVVSRRIRFSGNSSVGLDCTTSNMRDIRSSRLIMLVE